jgi:putative salt-induced outer membrane protein YdiY
MRRESGRIVIALRRLALYCGLCALLTGALFGKRKDDIVVMKNGDKFTGEIKSLAYGELVFKSDYMADSVHLDWKKVKRLESKDTFIVTLSNGDRLTGVLQQEHGDNQEETIFRVLTSGTPVDVSPTEVIVIGQQESHVWDQLTGSISYGFGFASGNSATNSSLASNVAFEGKKNSIALAGSSQFDSQANAKNTNRFTFDTQYARMLTNHWLAAGLFSLLKSNQQDLNLRSTYGAGIGRRLVQTDRTALTVLGGGAYSHENYTVQPANVEQVRNNAEALLGVTFSTFRFSKLSFRSQTLVFPSVNELGRLRVTSQSNLKIELIRNFDWNFQFYENYDSRPPVNAPKNDLGITTSVGWTF